MDPLYENLDAEDTVTIMYAFETETWNKLVSDFYYGTITTLFHVFMVIKIRYGLTFE